jgi:hypothetical protein
LKARAALGLEVRLLGRFVVRRAGQEVAPAAFGGRLVQTLIRLLVTRRGSFVSKDVLAEALWSERLPADPAANIEVLVSRARRARSSPPRCGPEARSWPPAAQRWRCAASARRWTTRAAHSTPLRGAVV